MTSSILRASRSTRTGLDARLLAAGIAGLAISSWACAQPPGPDCEWCGAHEAPAELFWRAVIAAPSEPGERMVLSGTVYESDGRTPAENVVVYAYHTNAEGVYPKRGDETGNARRHGYLRGWMRTGADGRYLFDTIRPAPYRTHGGEPAHVHLTLARSDFGEYWINATWFADDPRVSPEKTAALKRMGGFSNVIALDRREDGTWTGRRDLILNPPARD